jgi:hypothetical protein
MTTPTAWYEDASTVHSVATWGVQTSQLTSIGDVLYFFEKPWKYEEIYDGWTKAEENR